MAVGTQGIGNNNIWLDVWVESWGFSLFGFVRWLAYSHTVIFKL